LKKKAMEKKKGDTSFFSMIGKLFTTTSSHPTSMMIAKRLDTGLIGFFKSNLTSFKFAATKVLWSREINHIQKKGKNKFVIKKEDGENVYRAENEKSRDEWIDVITKSFIEENEYEELAHRFKSMN